MDQADRKRNWQVWANVRDVRVWQGVWLSLYIDHKRVKRRAYAWIGDVFFFFQAEGGIRDWSVTGVQTCALPISAPITTKHKFELAWKSASDPVTLAGVGVLAGIDQAADRWGAYGQGVQGYAKRYGASYANVFASTFIGGAVMPSILKQDPRYFYKGSGRKRSRLLYAVASSVICKGDNGRWQPNYSNVIGSFAGAGLQSAYLPANDRRGSGFIDSSELIRLGETSLAGVLQEFVFSKVTKHPRRSPSQP